MPSGSMLPEASKEQTRPRHWADRAALGSVFGPTEVCCVDTKDALARQSLEASTRVTAPDTPPAPPALADVNPIRFSAPAGSTKYTLSPSRNIPRGYVVPLALAPIEHRSAP